MRILFTPIGSNDPYSIRQRGAVGADVEGSAMTVLRAVNADRVYLFFNSGVEGSMQDSAVSTAAIMQSDFPDTEVINLPQIGFAEPHDYDAVFPLLDMELSSIRQDFPEAEIVLNTSSGTPAIKAALMILHTLGRYHTKAYQVSDRGDMRLVAIEKYGSLTNEIYKQNILSLIGSYEYVAAKQLAEQIDSINRDALKKIRKAATDYQLRGGICPLFGAILVLEIKLKKEEYRDFVVRVTPIISELFQRIIKKYYPPFCDCLADDKQKILIEKAKNDPVLLQVLESEISKDSATNRGVFIYNKEYLEIIKRIPGIAEEIVSDCKYIRRLEDHNDYHLRNDVSHQLSEVTLERIKKACDPELAIEALKRLYTPFGMGERHENWNHFNNLNKVIAEKLNESAD